MRPSETEHLALGLYRVHWNEEHGGQGMAAVGMNEHGDRWLAPANWSVVPTLNWCAVERVELLEARGLVGLCQEIAGMGCLNIHPHSNESSRHPCGHCLPCRARCALGGP